MGPLEIVVLGSLLAVILSLATLETDDNKGRIATLLVSVLVFIFSAATLLSTKVHGP